MGRAVDKYRACADAGMSQAEAASVLDVSREAVRQIADRHGIVFRDGKASTIDAEAFGTLVGSGMSNKAAAAHFGVSASAIHFRAKRLGLKLRHSTATPLETIKRIIEMHDDGAKQTDIAAAFGVSQAQVSAVLIEAGRRTTARKGSIQAIVLDMHRQGFAPKDIAAAINRQSSLVRNTLCAARKKGLIE